MKQSELLLSRRWLPCQKCNFGYTYFAWGFHSDSFPTYFPHTSFLLQPFPPPHVMSSPLWMKPRLSWNGVSHGIWAAAMTPSTTSSVRSACLNVECVPDAMTTWISPRATWVWPSVEWRCAIYKPIPSTALRFRQSMEFPTKALTHLSFLLWISPLIKPVSVTAQFWRHMMFNSFLLDLGITKDE